MPETGFRVRIRSVKRMGWKPDLPDFRDRVIEMPRTRSLPSRVDLRPKEHFEVYDQGHLGSCTANAIGAAFHFDQIKQGLSDFTPCRLFIYYNERALEGNIETDSGAYIRDGMKTMKDIGCCAETLWPYDEGKFTTRPADSCYEQASHNRCLEYARVPQTVDGMKAVVAEGFPFVFGFLVLTSFMTQEVAKTGEMKMPQADDQVMGGHAVCCVGYDDDRACFIVRNSWGEGWGDGGYFYMPYEFLAHPQLAQDLWYMQTVEGQRLPSSRSFGQAPKTPKSRRSFGFGF